MNSVPRGASVLSSDSASAACEPPLILYSGLAADARVFAPQKIAFPKLIVPKWLPPHPSDTLDTYCDRLAEELRPHGNAVLGGVSFGGIIVLHVAQRLNPLCVLLIGSVRSPAELPRFARWSRSLKPLIRWMPVRFLQCCHAPLASRVVRRFLPHVGGLARQFHECDPAVFRWSLSRIVDWSTTPAVNCPVFQIHGDRDFVLPMRHTNPDTVVHGGGHVISLTHAKEVNSFIRSAMGKVAGEVPASESTGPRSLG